jgi:signal peptidase II
MKKRDFSLIISLVLGAWVIDYITKLWAVKNILGLQMHGPVGFVLHRNPGAMLGTFAELPPLLRIVSLSTGGAFLIFIFMAIQYLLPKRSLILRSGMSILLGGIIGNVTDRILHGSVVDFIVFNFGKWLSPAFNIADAVQWVGYAMIVYTLIAQGEQIWPSKDERKKIWVIPKFQIKYIAVLIFIGIGFSLISGVFAYTFIKITIDDIAKAQAIFMEKKFLSPFLITYSVISFSFVIVLFIIGRIISHRTAGPIYAFEKYIEDLLDGKDRIFRVRAGDELPHLVEIGERLREHFLEFNKDTDDHCLQPQTVSEDTELNKDEDNDEGIDSLKSKLGASY